MTTCTTNGSRNRRRRGRKIGETIWDDTNAIGANTQCTNKPRDWPSTPKSIALMTWCTHRVAVCIPWSPGRKLPINRPMMMPTDTGSDLRLLAPSTSLLFVPFVRDHALENPCDEFREISFGVHDCSSTRRELGSKSGKETGSKGEIIGNRGCPSEPSIRSRIPIRG